MDEKLRLALLFPHFLPLYQKWKSGENGRKVKAIYNLTFQPFFSTFSKRLGVT
jgi:hypothetical protein